jgi:hypothetical protein
LWLLVLSRSEYIVGAGPTPPSKQGPLDLAGGASESASKPDHLTTFDTDPWLSCLAKLALPKPNGENPDKHGEI